MGTYKTRKTLEKKISSKLQPIPKSFLLDFHIDQVREQRHHELLKRSAKIVSILLKIFIVDCTPYASKTS